MISDRVVAKVEVVVEGRVTAVVTYYFIYYTPLTLELWRPSFVLVSHGGHKLRNGATKFPFRLQFCENVRSAYVEGAVFEL
ncbi:hypothetical protein Tcan_12208 [Toxocara canis]|uniref:Uncharacterized protein n=1 Tax=Toxocara canis TaxID=6265 RepID=A0A0B2W182_TOXCA|nr:hypothetical protein Tcan_12208 [Toxocara canis]